MLEIRQLSESTTYIIKRMACFILLTDSFRDGTEMLNDFLLQVKRSNNSYILTEIFKKHLTIFSLIKKNEQKRLDICCPFSSDLNFLPDLQCNAKRFNSSTIYSRLRVNPKTEQLCLSRVK